MPQPTNQNTETTMAAQENNVRLVAVIGLCLTAVIIGWGVDFILGANDDALRFFIEMFLPIITWLLRLPEYFVV